MSWTCECSDSILSHAVLGDICEKGRINSRLLCLKLSVIVATVLNNYRLCDGFIPCSEEETECWKGKKKREQREKKERKSDTYKRIMSDDRTSHSLRFFQVNRSAASTGLCKCVLFFSSKSRHCSETLSPITIYHVKTVKRKCVKNPLGVRGRSRATVTTSENDSNDRNDNSLDLKKKIYKPAVWF